MDKKKKKKRKKRKLIRTGVPCSDRIVIYMYILLFEFTSFVLEAPVKLMPIAFVKGTRRMYEDEGK